MVWVPLQKAVELWIGANVVWVRARGGLWLILIRVFEEEDTTWWVKFRCVGNVPYVRKPSLLSTSAFGSTASVASLGQCVFSSRGYLDMQVLV